MIKAKGDFNEVTNNFLRELLFLISDTTIRFAREEEKTHGARFLPRNYRYMKKMIYRKLSDLRGAKFDVIVGVSTANIDTLMASSPAGNSLKPFQQLFTEYFVGSYHDAVLDEFVRSERYEESIGYTAADNYLFKYQYLLGKIYSRAGDLRGKSVIEFGCGPGVVVEILRRLGGNVPLIQGALMQVPVELAGKSFDLTFSNLFLDALATIETKPDNSLKYRRLDQNERLKVIDTIAALTSPGAFSMHVTCYSMPFTKTEFKQAGFKVIKYNRNRTLVILRKEFSSSPVKGKLKIIVQSGLGELSGYSDGDYGRAKAIVVPTPEQVWQPAHLVVKIKELLIEGGVDEFALMRSMRGEEGDVVVIGVPKEIKLREGRAAVLPDGVSELLEFAEEYGCLVGGIRSTLSTYCHCAASREMTERVLKTGGNVIALETILGEASKAPLFNTSEWIDSEGEAGRIVVPRIVKHYKERLGKTLVCLDPMSIVAGIEAILQGVVYLNQDKVRLKEDKVEADKDWVDYILNPYPDCPNMHALEGKSVLTTGGGTVGLSALWQARRLSGKVVISDRKENLPLISEVLSDEYGGERVSIHSSRKRRINEALRDYDIVVMDAEDTQAILEALIISSIAVGAALVPGGRAPKTLRGDIIKQACDTVFLRRFLPDGSIDQGGNFEVVDSSGRIITDVPPTYHHDPVRAGYKGLIYYLVGNMPGRPGVISRAASEMLWAARLPYLKALIQYGLVGAAERDPGLKEGICVVGGRLTDKRVADTEGFGGFGWVDIDKALSDYSPRSSSPVASPLAPQSSPSTSSGLVVSKVIEDGRVESTSSSVNRLAAFILSRPKTALFMVRMGEAAQVFRPWELRASAWVGSILTLSIYSPGIDSRVIMAYAQQAATSEVQVLSRDYLPPILEGAITFYQISQPVSLRDLSKILNMTPQLLRKLNNLHSDTLVSGQTLKAINLSYKIIISRMDKKLYFCEENGRLIREYPIGVGKKKTKTPLGVFEVTERLERKA